MPQDSMQQEPQEQPQHSTQPQEQPQQQQPVQQEQPQETQQQEPQETQQQEQPQATQTQQSQQETQQQTVQVVAYEDARQLVGEAVTAANDANAEALRSALDDGDASDSVVTIGAEQYDTLTSLLAASMQGQVIAIGLCALIAGLLVVLIVTIHWRLR